MTEEHNKAIKMAEWKSHQQPLIGIGIVVKESFEGIKYRIGDYVELIEPSFKYKNKYDEIIISDDKPMKGILTLILDQGVCLISDKYWMQISRDMISKWKWSVIDAYETDLINLYETE